MRSENLSYFEDEEFKESLQEYESALNEGRPVYMDADDLTDIAEYYMIKEREEDANECIGLAVSLHPDAIDPQVFLARQQMFHGNLEEAQRLANSIPEENDREVKFLQAELMLKRGQREEASKYLKSYYDTLEEDRDFFLYDTAGVFMDFEEWELAFKWTKYLKEEFPKFDRTDILLSDILVSWGKVAEAEPMIDKILTSDPFNKEAWNLMAEAQSGQEHYSEALESIEYLLAIDEKHLQGNLIKANCLFHLNRMEEAHEQYKKYLEMEPNDVSIHYFDAVALSNLERYQEAANQLETALSLVDESAPDLPHIFMQMSYVMSRMGNTERALFMLTASYQAALRMQDWEYYLLRGHIYAENKNKEKAEECFEQARELSDDKQQTELMIAIDYAENEEWATATQILTQLMESDMPDKEANCMPYLAYCAYFTPQHPHFKEYLHRAAKSNPSLTEFLFSPIYPHTPVSDYENL